MWIVQKNKRESLVIQLPGNPRDQVKISGNSIAGYFTKSSENIGNSIARFFTYKS